MSSSSVWPIRIPASALACVVACTASAGDSWELYVGSWESHNVLRINLQTGDSEMFIPTGLGSLSRAHDMSFGPDGQFYVASYGNSRVLKYDGQSGAFIEVLVSGGNGLINTHSVFWNQDDTLLVASEGGDLVNRYSIDGTFLGRFVNQGEAGLDAPEALVRGPNGLLYLSAHFSKQVLKLDPINGGVIEAFVFDDPNTGVDETGGLDWAHGMDFGPDGNLYVASSNNNRVLRYNGQTGEFIDVFASGGGMSFPIGLEFGPDGNLYVGSFANDRIIRFDGQTGQFIDTPVNLAALGLIRPLLIHFLERPPATATLTDVIRTLGIHVSGGVAELVDSDDTYYVLQSGPGLNPAEPHPARADFGFDTGGTAASTLDITFEEKANIGGPTAVVLLRNWNSGQWDEIARHGLSPADQSFEMQGIPASDYINGSERIEVRVRSFAILVLNPTVRGIFSHDFLRVNMIE